MILHGVVTMDIVNSRKIYGRREFQQDLINCIEYMNEKHAGMLAAPISITLGDEWQLITSRPHQCYNLVHEFQSLLWRYGVDLYAGMGIGELSTCIYDDIRMMDGPCFYLSREAINIAKRKYKTKDSPIYSKQNRVLLKLCDEIRHISSSIAANIDGVPELDEAAMASIADGRSIFDTNADVSPESVINTIIENNEILISRMTGKQKKVYIDYIKYGTYRNMVNSGDYGSESIGGISQKINGAEFFAIRHNIRMISSLIHYYCSIADVKR